MVRNEFKTKEQNVRHNHQWQKTLIANITLFTLGIAMSISGLVIQCHYHLQKSPNESIIFTLNHTEWYTIHVWISILFLLVTIYHVWVHRKWYSNILKRNLPAQHKPTIILTVLTFMVVTSGLIPLFILHFNGNPTLRFSMIEIHDKIAIIFFIVVFRHTIKRFKWYVNLIKNKFKQNNKSRY